MPSQLEVVDGEIPVRIVGGDEPCGLSLRPGMPPEEGLAGGSGEDAAHAATRGVVCARPCREVRDDLPDVCGAGGERGEQQTPIIQLVMNLWCEAYAAAGTFEGGV
jgi:hypothetical protein